MSHPRGPDAPSQPLPSSIQLPADRIHERIGFRLLVWFLLIALLPLGVVTTVLYSRSEAALRQATIDNLTTEAAAKARQLEGFASARQTDVTLLAGNPAVIDSMRRLAAGESAAAVSAADRRYLEQLVRASQYVDLYLISPAGRVVLALEQPALTGSVLSGPAWQATELPGVFDRARTLIQTEISKFESRHAGAEPTAFIAAPVLDQGLVIGVVAIELRAAAIYATVADNRGLGVTGETLVGQQDETRPPGDRLLVTSPLRHDANAAFSRSFAVAEVKPRVGDVRPFRQTQRSRQSTAETFFPLQDALAGNAGAAFAWDYRGQSVLAAWRYLPSLRWGMVIKQDVDEAFAPMAAQGRITLILAGVTAGVVVLAALLLARGLARPITRMTAVVRQFSAGLLDARIPTEQQGQGELAVLSAGFNDMAQRLGQLVSGLEQQVAERTRHLHEAMGQVREQARLAAGAKEAADRANHAKSLFLANMSHELRTAYRASRAPGWGWSSPGNLSS